MPKTTSSSKAKAKAKNKETGTGKKELVLRDTIGQEYGQITKVLGNKRFEITCFDGKSRLGHIRGGISKKMWISTADVVLVSLRDFEQDKCDIIFKYDKDQVKELKRLAEIPSEIKTVERTGFETESDNEIEIEFENI